MALTQANFNAAAYAAENSEAMAMGFTPWEHYNLGANEIPYYDQHYFKPNPNATSPEEIAYEASMNSDIQGTELAQDPEKALQLYNLKATNPNAYYSNLATAVNDSMFNNWSKNWGGNEGLNKTLESIKAVNPSAYYSAKLTDYGRQLGWQIGQNRSDRNAPTEQAIKDMVPAAIAAGLSVEQINSLVGNNLNIANAMNQQRIINSQASGGNFWAENLIGAAKVGALALGAYGLDTALAAGAGAGMAGNAGVGLTAPSMAGDLALTTAPTVGTIGGYGSIAAPSLAGGLGVGSGGVLGGGALSTETIATMEAMNAGAGYGLNASQVPNLAAGLELGAIPTSGLSSLLSNAGNLVKGASLAKGLLGAGKNPLQAQAVGAPQAQGRQYAGVDYSPILNLLSIQQPQRSKTSLLG